MGGSGLWNFPGVGGCSRERSHRSHLMRPWYLSFPCAVSAVMGCDREEVASSPECVRRSKARFAHGKNFAALNGGETGSALTMVRATARLAGGLMAV